MTITTSYGFPLSPGDHAGNHDIPICCDDMVGKDSGDGGRDYTCPGCGAVVSISASGLVDDIREGVNA
jgi:predicted RNA-binding Zn-ribbon protein involved in translation (DUF1610 family)